MKIYNEEETKKSWAVKLHEDGVDSYLNAVDSETGKFIAHLISFHDKGDIVLVRGAKEALVSCGYIPHEHGNEFDGAGRLIIEN